MAKKPQISPMLRKVFEKGKKNEEMELLLADGRKVICKLDCLTYANKSDDDDADVMVALVCYKDGDGELFAEDDIVEVV